MITCTACQFENPAGARFCCQCGTALSLTCSRCGAVAVPGARFCHACATPLSAAPGAAAAPVSERRHLTVMFCDLVGSTALSAELDPEDFQLAVREYQIVCDTMVRRFDGHIAQFLGDGILVYFGYPQAHEDDAHRAARAALTILEALAGLNERLRQKQIPRLQVRIGVHTGIVVIGEMGGAHRRAEQLALGETPNLAARIQSQAEPDAVLVSGATHRLIEGYFECRNLGPAAMKGIAQPVLLYQVLRESTAQSRLEVIGKADWTPLVGREQDMAQLLLRWEHVKEGKGEAVVIVGEGGIGKSRLVQTLAQHAADERQAWLTPLQCSPYHQSSALYPMVDFLNRVVFQFDKTTTAEDRQRKVEGLCLQYRLPLAETVPLFDSLLAIPASPEYPPLNLSPERQKQNTLVALASILIERSTRQPLVFLVEDLQWIDPTTLELLTLVVDQVPDRRMLALYTCRPEFNIPWKDRAQVTTIALTRLSQEQIAEMITRITNGKKLPDEVVDQIVKKTDGVPLFVEELTKMVLESGFLVEEAGAFRLDRPLPPLAIPTTLQGSLMARLDRLSTTKDLAQLCAVLGREFTGELLEAVTELKGPVLARELMHLIEAELLFQRGTPPNVTYVFKHMLIQQAAYQSLLKSKRQQHHLRIARVLKQRFVEIAAVQPELLAHHFTEAGLYGEAIDYWSRAGEQAVQRSAHVEAIAHLTRGLDLLSRLPENPGRDQLEIKLRIRLGPSLTAIKGYGSLEVEQTYTRAKLLCEQGGDSSQLFLVLYGLWRLNMLRAKHETARTQGEQLYQLAAGGENPSFHVAAHRALGATLFYLGDLAGSRREVEMVLDATSEPRGGPGALIQDIYDVVDPRVTCRSYYAWNLWLLGFPDQARAESRAAIELARALDHPFSLALALSFGSWLHQFVGDVAQTHALSQAAVTLAEEQGFVFWIGWGKVLRGWAASHDGNGVEAITEIRRGLAEWRAQGSELGCAYFLTLLADALARHGNLGEALEALADAEVFACKTSENYWLAERHRLAGELLLAKDPACTAPAEALFVQARELAGRQQARSLELRAAISLARLWRSQQRHGEIAALLQPILAQFTEGLETKDVAEARALAGGA